MSEYYNYITAGDDDLQWGLYLTVAGFQEIEAGAHYPPKGHPSSYYFNWDKGRVLDEYQIIFITKGEGVYENHSKKTSLQAGHFIMLYPGQWHRYMPKKETGWKEYYIGFKGEYADKIFSTNFFSKDNPVQYLGYGDNIHSLLHNIIDEVKYERPGFQQVCAGYVISVLGQILSELRNKEFEGKEVEQKIREARIFMRENVQVNLDMQNVAEEVEMGYSHFRKSFKKFTGISPSQFHLMLRIQKAKDLLICTDMSVNEVALELGFQSIFYFTRIFTKKTGYTPTDLRQKKHMIN